MRFTSETVYGRGHFSSTSLHQEQITDLLEPGSSNLQIREERALQMETLEFEFSVVLSFFPLGPWLWFHESRMFLECLFVLWGHQSWCLRRTAQWAFCLVCIGCIPCSVEGRVSDKEAALLKSLYELRFGWPNTGRYYHVYIYIYIDTTSTIYKHMVNMHFV